MKLRIASALVMCALTSIAFANPIPGTLYAGIFGGGGSSSHVNANQYGTAFFTEAQGGPLSVNAYGQLDHEKTAFYGVQLGYQAQEIALDRNSQWSLVPGLELEGFITNKRTFNGDLINNTARLPEHDFAVSYPTRKTVFLANLVLNFDNPCYFLSPYIGFGIGNAIARISDADATQISPAEWGINHYSANSSDTDSAFAGQIKLGLNYDLSKCVSLFAEYRWLYIANTHYVFGSTVYPTHVETSSWQVNLDAQRYNLGNIGIRMSF